MNHGSVDVSRELIDFLPWTCLSASDAGMKWWWLLEKGEEKGLGSLSKWHFAKLWDHEQQLRSRSLQSAVLCVWMTRQVSSYPSLLASSPVPVPLLMLPKSSIKVLEHSLVTFSSIRNVTLPSIVLNMYFLTSLHTTLVSTTTIFCQSQIGHSRSLSRPVTLVELRAFFGMDVLHTCSSQQCPLSCGIWVTYTSKLVFVT